MADPLIVPGLNDPNSFSDADGTYLQFLKNLAPGLLANALPSDKQTGAAGYVPGALAGMYAVGDLAQRGVQNLAMLPTKYFAPDTWANFKSTPLPGADTAMNIVKESEDRARGILGVEPPDPTSLSERAGAAAGIAAGSMGMPFSAPHKLINAALSAINPVSAVGPVGKMVLPTVGAGLATGAEAIPDALMQDRLAGLQAAPGSAPAATDGKAPGAAPQQVMDTKPVSLDEFVSPKPVSLEEFIAPVLPDQQTASMTGTTYGDVVLGIAGVLGVIGGAKVAITGLRNFKNARIEEVTRKVAAEQDAVARGAPGASANSVGQPTLPGVLPTDKVVAATLDNTVPLQQVVKATSPTPQIGDLLSARVGNLANQGGYTARLQSFVDSGYDPNASRRYMALGDVFRSIERAPEHVKNGFSEVRALMDELDNRAATRGVPHNFPELNMVALNSRVTQLMADPAIANLVYQRRLVANDVTHWLVDRGLLTQHQAGLLRSRHPYFMPSANETGLIDNPLSARNLTPYGGESVQTLKAWEADKQHIDALFRAVERNELQNIIVNSMLDYQRRNPRAAKWITLSPQTGVPGQVGNTAEDVLHFTVRQNGQLNNYRVHSKELYDYVDGIGQRLYVPVLSEAKQFLQLGTTGPLGWIVGNVRAPAIAAYNAAISAVTRPKGTSFGYIDKALNTATGGRIGLKGDVTGLVLGAPVETAIDSLSLLAKGFSQALEPGANNLLRQAVSKVIGDTATDFVSANLKRRWERSQLFERRAYGVSGSGGFGSVEPPTSAKLGVGPATGADKLNNMYPDLFRRYSRLPLGNAAPAFVRVGQLAHNINQLITEAHAAHFWRLNRNVLPKPQLVRETRRLSGDIGEIGSSKSVQFFNQSVPYFTPSVQGGRRVISEMQKHPLSTSMGVVNFLTVPILASIFMAMMHGEDTMEDLVNDLNSDRAAAGIPLYLGPDPTTDKVVIDLEHSLRGPYALMSSMFHDILRIMHDSGTEGKQALFTALGDIFSKFISTTDADKMITGATGMFSVGLPPPVTGLLNTADVSLPNDWVSRSIQGDNVWVKSEVRRSIPGVVDSVDPVTGAAYNNAVIKMISSLSGAASTAFSNIYTSAANTYAKTDSVGDALLSAAEAWSQNLGDSTRTGALWGQTAARGIRTGFIEQTERKMQAINDTQGATNAIRLDGQMTRRRGELISPGMAMKGKLPSDPDMAALYQIVSKYGAVANRLAAPATDAKKQLDALRSSGLPPQEQRARLNEQTRIYQDRMREVSDYLNTIESVLSERVGKQVVLEQIDWDKGLDQFRDLPSR